MAFTITQAQKPAHLVPTQQPIGERKVAEVLSQIAKRKSSRAWTDKGMHDESCGG